MSDGGCGTQLHRIITSCSKALKVVVCGFLSGGTIPSFRYMFKILQFKTDQV